MASQSASSKRPLPKIVENKGTPANFNDDGDSDSGGRRHISSSVPRTTLAHGAEKMAMTKIKKKMTFSDHSAPSSAKSTPRKPNQKPDPEHKGTRPGFMTDPGQLRHKSHHPVAQLGSANFVPASYSYGGSGPQEEVMADTSDYASEGELTGTLTVSSLLSKLDSVKNFLKEAEVMRVKFEEKKTEPGMMTQLNKLDKLIDQLQQQESGYLGELLRLMELEGSKCELSEEEEDATFSEDEEVDDEGEDNDGFSSDEDDPTDQMVLAASEKAERASGDESGEEEEGSLSLRAQMELEQQAEQELLALQQQKAMLTQLLEKQKQIQELEAKQVALLEMKTKAEEQLKEAEAKGQELQKLAEVAEMGNAEPNEREQLVLKLSELKARKERVDQMARLLHTMRTNGDEHGGAKDDDQKSPPPSSPQTSLKKMETQGNIHVAESAQAAGGADELVADKPSADGVPGMEELQMKLREAAEVRKKLLEARKLMAIHKDHSASGDGEAAVGEKKDQHQLPWTIKTSPEKVKSKKGNRENMTSFGQDPIGLERSLVSDYKAKLVKKKGEVVQLLREREELKATQKQLLNLQKKMNHKQFLDDSLQDHEVFSQTDVTAATWGGSTIQSDPEDTATSVSLPSDIVADLTHESTQNAELLDHGEGATVEQIGRGKTPPFSVTRHTPRVRPNVRLRTRSLDSPDATPRADKKMKVDPGVGEKSNKTKFGSLKNSLASSFKASFHAKGAAKGSTNASKATPKGMSGTNGPSLGGAALMGGTGDANQLSFQQRDTLLSEHTATLQNQLALTSSMCNQLLYGQNSLIRAVCERLDHPELHPRVQEHMTVLQHYQLELEAYYHQLCESYAQLQQQEGVGQESEEPMAPGVSMTGDETVIEGTPSQHPTAAGPPIQLESVEERPSPPEPAATGYSSHMWYPSHSYPSSSPFKQPPTSNKSAAPSSSASYLPPPPPLLTSAHLSPNSYCYHGQPLFGSPHCNIPPPPGMGMGPGSSLGSGVQHDHSPPSVLRPVPLSAPSGSIFNQPVQYPPSFGYGPYLPYSYPSQPGRMDLNTSFDNQGLPHFRTLSDQFNFRSAAADRGNRFGLLSPSGVTASSLQVQAPSSPPSAPSVNMQPGGEGAGTMNQEKPNIPTTATTQTSIFSPPSTSSTIKGMPPPAQSQNHAGSGGTEKVKKNIDGGTKDDDENSMSSLPMSVRDDDTNAVLTAAPGEGNATGGFSVFDTLRDTIYSEVATLIANNENRPHFLVELFRELQMLSTDYLRQRALYSLQDLVTRFLTEEAVANEAKAAINEQYENWLGGEATGDSTDSESEGGSSVARPKPPVLANRASQGFDYVEDVKSASSVSTPPDEPFASDNLGETVINLSKAVARMGGMSQSRPGPRGGQGLEVPIVSPLRVDGYETPPTANMQYSDVDTKALDEQIKYIMMNVIPLLKDNLENECTSEMIQMIGERILSLVTDQEKGQKQEFLGVFRKQLESTITASMEKYLKRKFRDCGEDLLMDVSEVLFNELAFFKLMQDFKGHPQLSDGDFRSITSSQTTTEAEDNEFDVEGEAGMSGKVDSSGAPPVARTGENRQQMLDPALLQLLGATANLTLQEEEETLGKARDDALAASWDPSVRSHERSSSPSIEERDTLVNMVELSVSESQPIEGIGSGEEDVEGKKVTKEVELSHSSEATADATLTEPKEEPASGECQTREVTPPTPLAVSSASALVDDPNLQLASTPKSPSNEGKDEATGMPSQDKDRSFKVSSEGDETTEEDKRKNNKDIEQVSTITNVLSHEVVPQMTGELEERMKAEQQSVEGASGILASMKEQDKSPEFDLVGDENEMAVPITSNGI